MLLAGQRGDAMQDNDHVNYSDLREGFVELMAHTIQPNVFLTLVTNAEGSPMKLRRAIKDLLARLDRALLGPKWQKQSKDQRTEGVFIIEHVESNIHAHGMLRLPSFDEAEIYMTVGTFWNKLCPSGNSCFRLLEDALVCARYCTKEMDMPWFSGEQIVCTWDFMNR
jgi:hypothetical protein